MNQYPNWFAGMMFTFKEKLVPLSGTPIHALQIGAYTGDCSLWLCENVLTHPDSRLDDVDTWSGSMEHEGWNFNKVEQIYNEKLDLYIANNTINKYKMTSDAFFEHLRPIYDFVYVDGNHMPQQVLKDAINAFEHTKPGGIIAFDDYQWDPEGYTQYQKPKIAIDAFIACYRNEIEIIHNQYQLWIRKNELPK